MVQELLDKIARMEKRTPTERKLALFFEKNYMNLVLEDLEGISAKTGISQSTVSRFITKLGYANFKAFSSEMRRAAADKLDTPIERYGALSEANLDLSTPEDILQQHLNDVCNIIQATLKSVRAEDFGKALDLLCDEKRHLFLLGSVVSEPTLRSFSIILRYIRPNFTQLRVDASDIARQIACMPKDAVLLALGNRPYSATTYKTLEHFRENNHDIIAITDSTISPFYSLATVPLVVMREGKSMFHTRCSAMALLEALASGIALRKGSDFTERFSTVSTLMNKFSVFLAR